MKNLKLGIGLVLLMLIVVTISYFKSNRKQKVTKVNIENVDTTKNDTTYSDLIDVPEINSDWIDSGKVIYKMHCAACHSFIRDYSGPKITDKVGFGRMYEIIRSVNDLEKSGDKYTINMLKEWDEKAPRMPEFKDVLTDDQLKMLLSYLKYETTELRRCVH